jgi:hypothetical protein
MKLNRPNLLPEASVDAQLRMSEGQTVGELATRLWPEGILLRNYDQQANAAKTKELLASGQRVPLFEAGFLADVENVSCFARVDILVPAGKDSWDLYEVKSSTKVKEEHLHDVAFQARVLTQSGLQINRINLIHINKEYVKQEHLDLNEFFTKEDVTDQLASHFDDADHFIPFLLQLAQQDHLPNVLCASPKTCEACKLVLPEHSVFELANIKSTQAKTLWDTNYKLITELPQHTKLTKKQAIQSVAVLTNQPHVEAEHIHTFLNSLTYPLYHLDFETIGTAIPLYPHTTPYEQIPFQYSLHVEEPTGEIKHIEFLAQPSLDPRPSFLASLKAALANTSGNILAYNASFEARILRKLMSDFPEHEVWITDVLSRLKDLAEPFGQFWYYHPRQHGSYSIKALLPIMSADAYKDLTINNGSLASASFLALQQLENKEEIQSLRAALLAYCKQDTQSMLDVLGFLKQQ